MQEESCASSEVAQGALAGIFSKKDVKRLNCLGIMLANKECVWPRKIQHAEVDSDVIEVVCVSSDSDVVLCCLSADSLALLDLLTDIGACVFRVVQSGFSI